AVNYALGDGIKFGADYLFGTGLRSDGHVVDGLSMRDDFQLNLSVSRDFDAGGAGKIHNQLAVIHVLARVYELRDGTGVGVGAPQFGPRRGVFLTVSKDF